MSIRRTVGVTLAMGASLATWSCDTGLMHHRQQARVFLPPPPPPKPVIAPTPELPPAPDASTVLVPTQPPLLASITGPNGRPNLVELGPPPPAPVKRPPPAPPKREQASAPQPEAPPLTPTPKLGQMFTPAQEREYNQTLAESFARVDSALARLEGRQLTADQIRTADRIRTFRRQAEQAREQDLVTAVSLARRADLLAKDLLGHLP